MAPRLSNVLQGLTVLALDDLDDLWSMSPAELEAALFGVFPDVLETWSEAAMTAAADWYDELRESAEVAGRFSAIVEPIDDLGTYALAGWAAEPLKLPEPDVLSVKSRLEDGFQAPGELGELHDHRISPGGSAGTRIHAAHPARCVQVLHHGRLPRRCVHETVGKVRVSWALLLRGCPGVGWSSVAGGAVQAIG